MATLLRRAPSLNTYEGMYDRLSSKASFNHDEWIHAANEGTLDMYAAGIDKFESLGIDYQKYKDDLNLSFADTKTRMTALYNEVYADRENQKERERTVYDEYGAPRIEKYIASDYDYNKELIKSQNDYREEVERKRIADEAKEAAGFFENLGWGTLGIFTGLGQGVLQGIGNLTALGDAAIRYLIDGNKSFAQQVTEAGYDNVFNNLAKNIAEFETKYSTLRYANGDYTNLGKYVGSASTSVGEMIPSMLIGKGVGGILTKAGVSAATTGAIAAGTAQATFYAGMFSGSVKDMYTQFQVMGADVDSSSIIANAAIKSALQWGIEKALGKILGTGPTTIDEIFFGRARNPVGRKIGGWKAFGHILQEAGQEGLEEVLQDTSDFLVNEGFSNFIDAYGVNNEISFQSLLDAFTIGAMVSIAGSAVDVLKTRRVIGGDGKKLGKLASWEYGINMDSFARNVAEVMEKAGKVNYETDNNRKNLIQGAALEAYASYRMITSIYQEIGDERFKAANEVLDKITEQIQSGKFNKEDVTSYVENMRGQFGHVSNLALEKMVSELKKKNVKEVKRTIKADDNKATEKGTETKEKLTPKQARDKLEELFEESGAKTVTETDGNVEVEKDGNIVISSDRLNNESINEILQNLSVQNLVSHLSELSNKEHIRDNLSKTYEEYYGKIVSEDADVISLLFDADFFKAVLMKSNKDVFKYLSYFAEAEKNLVRGKRRDEIYRNKINEIRNHWFNHLADYCIIHEEARQELFLEFVTDKKLRKKLENRIKRERWSSNLYNKVVTDFNSLTDNEKVLLKNRIDKGFSKDQATRLWAKLESGDSRARYAVMQTISKKYQGIFENLYDGKHYLPDISIPNKVFNSFLKDLGLYADNLLDKNYLTESDVKFILDAYGEITLQNIFSFRKTQFYQKTNGYYELNKTNKSWSVSFNGKMVGYSEHADKIAQLSHNVFENNFKFTDQTFLTDVTFHDKLVSQMLNDDAKKLKNYLTVDDLVNDPSLLNDEYKNQIINFVSSEYGIHLSEPNPYMTFLYLRKYLIKNTGNKTLVLLSNGNVAIQDMTSMKNVLITEDVVIDENSKLEDIFKNEFIPNGLTLEFSDETEIPKFQGFVLDEDGNRILSNKIIIPKKYLNLDSDSTRFILLHEFQHAIQFANRTNVGFNTKFTEYLGREYSSVVRNFKKYFPDIFDKNMSKEDIDKQINGFVYASCGETSAFGLDGSSIISFYPILVHKSLQESYVLFPWGQKVVLRNYSPDVDVMDVNDDFVSQFALPNEPIPKKHNKSKYVSEDDPRAKDFIATPARQNAGYAKRYYVLNEDGTQKLDKQGKPIYKYIYPKKESRYVSKNKYSGTKLEPFAKSYTRTQMSPELQKFILNAKDLDPVLQNKIDGKEKGTLTQRYVFDYLRSKTKIDDNTFKQINDAFFKNEYIKTFDELQHRIDHSMRESWALYRLLKLHPKLQRNKHLLDDVDESFESIFPLIERNKEYLEMYAKLLLEYDDYNGKAFNVSDSYARMRYMRHYDGTVNSERDVSSVVRLIAMLEAKDKWNITKASNDVEFTEAYEEAVESLDLSHDEMVEAIWAREIAIAEKNGRDPLELKDELLEIAEMSTAEIRKLYNKKEDSVSRIVLEGLIADADGNYLYVSPDTPKITSSHLVNRMKGKIRSLKGILTPKEIAKIVEDNSDVFGKDLSINNELYQKKIRNKTRDGYHYENKSVEEVQEVFDKIAEICDRVREEKRIGKANVDARDKQIKELQRKIKQLERDKKNQKVSKIPKVHEIIVEGETLQIETNKEIPLSLLKILQVHYNKTAKSSVQNLSSDNKRHIKMVSETFLEENADNFNNLTQADVDEIIDFYLTTDVPFNNATTPYQLAEIWTLTYLVKQGRRGNPNFVIDNDKLSKIEHLLEGIIKRSATNLSTWRSALKELNPEAVIASAMARKIGVEVSEEDVERIVDAIDTKDMEKVEKVKGDIYKKLLKEHKKSKTDFLDKLLQYERLAMLSGPGTWVRNQASNAVITGVNKLSDGMSGKLEKVLNKLFPKSQYIESQYKIAGTKVTDEVSNYIANNLINNGLLDIVIDSLSKYDVRKPTVGQDSSAVLADMIAGSIKQQFQRQPLFANEKAQKVEKFLLKMISDDKSVKKAALGYLGKMITEDLETGRIKAKVEVLSENRISKHFMTYVAEAFKLASYDYMHKPNFFFSLESQIAKKSKGAYFMYKQVFPFVGASWNWFVEGLKYSPVGLAKSIINYAKLENTIDRYERKRQTFEYGDIGVSSDFAKYLTIRDINKGVIGSVGTLIGVLLAAFGVAKIDEDDDKYKLFVGDARIDISDVFGTQGMFLGIAVTSNIISEDADIVDTFSAALDQMFIDSTFADFFNTFRYSQNLGDWLTYQPISMLNMNIPNFLKTVTSLSTPYQVKYSDGILGKIEKLAVSAIPGLSYAFPHYYDPYTGEKQVAQKAWFLTKAIDKLTPLGLSVYNVTDMERLAIEQGVHKNQLTGRYKIGDAKIRLKAKDVERLNQFYGQLNSADLKELRSNSKTYKVKQANGTFKNLRWSQMTDKEKATIIDRIMTDNSGYSKIYILTDSGEYKYFATDAEFKALRALGITKNVYRKNNKQSGFVKAN